MLNLILKKIPLDKLLHFLVCACIVFTLAPFVALPIAAGFAFVIGLYKEIIHDLLMKKGTFETLDIVANIAGITYAAVILSF